MSSRGRFKTTLVACEVVMDRANEMLQEIRALKQHLAQNIEIDLASDRA